MAVNLSGLASVTTAASALTGLIMVTPQSVVGYAPQNPTDSDGSVSINPSAPAILFHYEGEQSVNLQSDITDHYVEDNTAVQDQIALRPVTVTTHGFIGELNNVAPFGLQTLKTAADKLTVIGPYAPQLSVTAQLAYNEAFLAYQSATKLANAAVSAWSSVSNAITGSDGNAVIDSEGDLIPGSVQNQQQKYFQQFYGYWVNRTLFTVQTPWAVFENMGILNLRAIQDAETNVITDFEVTFKQIRNAFSAFSGIPTSFAGRSATQAAAKTNQGISAGTPSAVTPASATSTTLSGGAA